jgi:hypothetical protein
MQAKGAEIRMASQGPASTGEGEREFEATEGSQNYCVVSNGG